MNVPISDATAESCLLSQLEPTIESKVDGLGTVETDIKSCVISTGICDHKFASSLHQGVWFDLRRPESIRRSQV